MSHPSEPEPSQTEDIGLSYIRFSTPEQSKGNSLQRQTEAAADWCQRNNVRLDTSITLHDLGKSAYTGAHRKNPDRHALAMFLKLVEQDRVPRGSYLVLENLDRLSREEEVPACHLLTGILMAGIRVVQMKPSELILTDKSNGFDIMRAVMELSRGHGESAMKEERNGKAWQAKIDAARSKVKQPPRRKDGRVVEGITDRLPAWIALEGDRLVLIPERADAVRRIFALACNGYGVAATVTKLIQEGVQPFGDREVVMGEDGSPETILARGKERPKYRGKGQYGSGVWNRAYVAKILKDRRALGEYQPCGKGRKPVGEPIPNYFPAVVTEQEFNTARAGAQDRQRRRGRIGRHVNVFAGLLRHARDGDTFFFGTAGGKRALIDARGADGAAPYVSFPAELFELSMRGFLLDIDPKEILEGTNGHNEVVSLEGEFGEVEAAIASISADLDTHGESPTLYTRLRKKETRRAELVKLLADARQKQANPLSASWGEMQALLGSGEGNEEGRMRLRGILRRTVEGIFVLIVKRGQARLCAVQVWFAGGERYRDFLIYHRQARANTRTRTERQEGIISLASVTDTAGLDLRRREHARKLEALLAAVDLETLARAMPPL